MQNHENKKKLLGDIARRIIEQWPVEDEPLAGKALKFVSQPLTEALDGERMDGTARSLSGAVIERLREGITEAIWCLDQLPVDGRAE